MITKWNKIDKEFFKDEIYDLYMDNNKVFEGKVLELYSEDEYVNGDYRRLFITFGINKSEYIQYDRSFHPFMTEWMKLGEKEAEEIKQKMFSEFDSSCSFIILKRPGTNCNLEKAVEDFSQKFSKELDMEFHMRFLKELVSDSPDIKICPAPEKFMKDLIWNTMIDDPKAGFFKEENGKQYIKVRTWDLDEFKTEVDQILNNKQKRFAQ